MNGSVHVFAVENPERVFGVKRENLTLVGQKRHVYLFERFYVLGRLRLGQQVKQLVVARFGEKQMRRSVFVIVRVEVVYERLYRVFRRLYEIDGFELGQRFAIFRYVLHN